MAKPFRTFVVHRFNRGPRYEVVGWGTDGGSKKVMLSPVGGGKDITLSQEEYHTNYEKVN